MRAFHELMHDDAARGYLEQDCPVRPLTMAAPASSLDAKTHVVTLGCQYLADRDCWAPAGFIRPPLSGSHSVKLVAKAEDCRDTPEDALDSAAALAGEWLVANMQRWRASSLERNGH